MNSNQLKDISTEADIKKLVDAFYDKVNQDSLLSPIFNDYAKVNWEKHLPIMYQFWSSILLGSASYEGQPFPKHAFLPVNPTHFAQWLSLFFATVTENFRGPLAEEAKLRAANIARIFSNKIQIIQGQAPGIPIVKQDLTK
ncbi:sec-independent protein translocase TatC [Adhaeribacter arboris]|uniref:Sec-independent protein translocase TatC n=1 Tax=Adhaeribacter arboris TaxID=2072846 RepID=A0A2T2YAV0_9BACT|nr:group III truncated hemoglobin [Adhaeribacter arboris]PSR52661.1 sec-independent protein translocase TatC [Adhaeribacter arboris]